MHKNAQIVKGFLYDYWNNKTFQGKNELFHPFSPQLIIDSPLGKEVGKTTLTAINQKWDCAFPDLSLSHIQVENYGNSVITTWNSTASHLAPFNGIEPTHKKIQYSGTTIFFFKGNQIVRYCCKLDMLTIYKQLGVRLIQNEYEHQDLLRKNKALLIKKIRAGLSQRLTNRETELLSLYVLGFSAKQIATFCRISTRTVETHLCRAIQELECLNKYQCLEKIIACWMLPIFQDLTKLLLEQYGVTKKSLPFG